MLRALTRTLASSVRLLLLGLLATGLLLTWPATGIAAGDPRLERAQQESRAAQERLDDLYQRLSAAAAAVEEITAELEGLKAQRAAHAERAGEANAALAYRVRESYIRGDADPTLTLLVAGSTDTVQEQARLLGLLALRSRADFETATVARVQTAASAEEVAHSQEVLAERQAELEGLQREAQQALAEAEAEEERVRAVIAREERERREREERERREREQRAREQREREVAQRASRAAAGTSTAGDSDGGSGSGSAGNGSGSGDGSGSGGASSSGGGGQQAASAPSGGVACPVGQPRNYSDTWGAPRSGGRSHLGTDIMAPRGTPIYAYESGTVTRLWNSRLGGISLYLRGDSGTQYFYTHLQGYVAGMSAGKRVAAGEHIAFNGDTGNARGIPHLHFEVMPGGGGNVNPYPYVRRACG